MEIPIYRSDAEHFEDAEEIGRDNDRRRSFGRQVRIVALEPARLTNATRYSFEPFTEGEPPHCTVYAPDWYTLEKLRQGDLGLFPNEPVQRAARGLTAWDAMKCVERREWGLRLVESPLRLAVNVAVVTVGGTASGRVYGLDEIPTASGEAVHVTPAGTVVIVGPCGAKVVGDEPERFVAVPIGNGSYERLTGAEAMDRAIRRVKGFVEAETCPLG